MTANRSFQLPYFSVDKAIHRNGRRCLLPLLLLFPPSLVAASVPHWFTYPTATTRPTGNRVLPSPLAAAAPGSISADVAIDVVLEDGAGDVVWMVGALASARDDGDVTRGVGELRFVVTTDAGRAYAILPSLASSGAANSGTDASWNAVRLEEYSPLAADSPPVVRTALSTEVGIEVVNLIAATDAAPLSHVVPISARGGTDDEGEGEREAEGCGMSWYAYISSGGDIVLYDDASGTELDRLEGVGALPDGLIVVSPATDDPPLLALFGGSTESYRHCVLGDCLEGTRILLVSVQLNADDGGGRDKASLPQPSLVVRTDVALPSGTVFEGLSPLFLRDGSALVATVADDDKGGRLRTYSTVDGTVLAESPYLGWGWRHQLFHADMGPPMAMAALPCIVDVLTPHVRKVVEFFDPSDLRVRPGASVAGRYTTHSIGSRNLDTGLAADMNGDGMLEAVLPTSNMTEVAGLQLQPSAVGGTDVNDGDGEEGEVRGGEGWDRQLEVREVYRLPLPGGGELSSNLAAIRSEEGTTTALAAAVGRTVRIWTSTRPSSAPESGSGSVVGDADGDEVENGTGSTLPSEDLGSEDDAGTGLDARGGTQMRSSPARPPSACLAAVAVAMMACSFGLVL